MAGRYVRLMDAYTPKPNEVQESDRVVDAGGFRNCGIDPRVLKTGSGGNVIIEHASVNEEGAWRTLATIDLTQGGTFTYVTTFLRFLRWRADAGVAGAPIVLVDLVLKE